MPTPPTDLRTALDDLMAPPAVERKYTMTKLRAGDYLLPSNDDGATLWRLTQYEDGPSYGIDTWEKDASFWRVARWTGQGDVVDAENWDEWSIERECLPTRKVAIHWALGRSPTETSQDD